MKQNTSMTNERNMWKKSTIITSVIILAVLLAYFPTAHSTDTGAPPEDSAVIDFSIDVYWGELLKTNLAIPPFKPAKGVRDGGSTGGMGAMIAGRDLMFSSYFNIIAAPALPPIPEGGYSELTLDFAPYESIQAELLIAGTYSLDNKGIYTFDLKLFDVSQKVMLTRAIYRGDKKNFRRLMHRFADEVLRSETGTAGPFEARIAFVAETSGRREIFICDTDGHNMLRLTHNDTINLTPSWSPDATKLVYTSYILHNPDIFILPVRGGKPKMLYGGKGINYGADWSVANNRIAFASSNNKHVNQEIYTIKPDRTGLVQVSDAPWSIDVSPSWSPDGTHIAYVTSRFGNKPQVVVSPANGGPPKRVSRTGGYNTDPSWGSGPLGSFITYCGRAGGGLDILAVKIGDGLKILETIAVVNGSGADEAPSISPDGRFVVYSHGRGNDYDIYMSSMREQKPRRITKMHGKETAPDWSPRLFRK